MLTRHEALAPVSSDIARPSDRKYLLNLRALGWDVRTFVDHAHNGARVIDGADPEHALPVPSPNQACAFPFARTAAKSKTEFTIKVEDAGAGSSPCDVLGPSLPREQKRKQNAGCEVPAHVREIY